MATAKKKKKSKAKPKAPKKKSVKKQTAKKPAAKKAATKANAKKPATKKLDKSKKSSAKPKAKPSAKKSASAKVKKPQKQLGGARKTEVKTQVTARVAPKDIKKMADFFTPLDDRLIVMVDLASTMTPGGIIIPVSFSEQPQKGEVLNVGRGRLDKKGKRRPMDVKPGEHVLFGPYSGSKMFIGDAEVLVLREEEVLGVVGS